MPPIHYLPHELSPLLRVLDDRVTEVTAMSARWPSYAHPQLVQPDMRVALMRTEKDAILRLATSFAQPPPAILAAESIRQGTRLLRVPDFRPGPGRRPGARPG